MQDSSAVVSGTVFQFAIAPAPGADEAEVEQRILERCGAFALGSRPHVSPLDLSHRVLRVEGARSKGDRYVWQITFEGLDVPGEEPSDRSFAADLIEEVHAQLEGAGVIVSSRKLADISPMDNTPWGALGGGSALSFGDDPSEAAPGWEAYSPTSRAPESGKDLTADLLADIKAARDAIPVEPGLKAVTTGLGGHMYSGGSDKAHAAYVKEYLTQRADAAGPVDRRRILSFLALQSREGSTSAINTYDNQIVSWGTGWGGRGGLGKVMEKAVANGAVRELFHGCGFRYLGKQIYEAVDLTSKKVVSGTAPALQVIRASVPLLNMLISASRGLATRDAVIEAQLTTFMEGSGNIPGAEMIASQALINMIAHLKHWAPGYVMGALEAIGPLVEKGAPSVARDRVIAPLVGRYFYAKARKTKWVPSFGQFKLYWTHMRDDGLDCMEDPFIKSPSPPTDGAFASSAPAAPVTA